MRQKAMTNNKKMIWLLQGLLGVLFLLASALLLKKDVWTFWTWWLLAGVLGLAAMPVTGRLFSAFEDKGWIFSKVLAIAVTGFLTWFLVSAKLAPFTKFTCLMVAVACGGLSLLLFVSQTRRGIECLPVGHAGLVYWEELIFFAVFLMWTYFAGFHPQASGGTEKFMDYGFMAAMMRSATLPPKDLWYSQGNLNYYYGGQYFAVFLTKLSNTKTELTYNLMRTFVAGLAFAMPFSLVYQMTRDRMKGKTGKKSACALAGLTAGLAVSIAGNMHYVIYAKIIPWIQKWKGEEVSGYWFPNATRYIGHNPDVPDKTIHEFPCYSFVLGDLHAHVVNIMFVLFLIGLLYGWMKKCRSGGRCRTPYGTKEFWKEHLAIPELLVAAAFLGMFQWTNYWDFIIYFVVTGGAIVFVNILRFQGKTARVLLVTLVQAVEIFFLAYLVILPFTIQFQTMVDGVALAKNHSRFYQLLVLWGLPAILTLLLVFSLLWEALRKKKPKTLYCVMARTKAPDLFAVLTGLCALGLVLIPELVYVRDIYENGNARANTMFKLTYQAYILFDITMGYGIYRLLLVSRQKLLKLCSLLGLFFLLWTVGYFGNSVHAWFGEVWDLDQYQGLNAAGFLDTEYPDDADAIRWLKENIKESPVVLEANGDSYSAYCRVSSATGLPTILGWYVHEWLWRSDPEDLNLKSGDVESIYTSQDTAQVQRLLKEYQVSYIFVGSKEREKYEGRLNETLLQSLGEVVFQDESSPTYILKMD